MFIQPQQQPQQQRLNSDKYPQQIIISLFYLRVLLLFLLFPIIKHKFKHSLFFLQPFLYNLKKSKESNMNGNNVAFTKLMSSLQDTQGASKDSKDIYESVLQKHFQIIQTFLQKINSLYLKNQDFENSISVINQKLQKIELSTQNIHYQFRTTHLMIDKRLNNIMTDYTNLNEQLKLIRKDLPFESYLSTQHFLSKSAHLKSRRNMKKNKDDEDSQEFNDYNIVINKNEVRQSISSKNQNQDNDKQNKILNLAELGFHIGRRSQTCQKIVQSELVNFVEGPQLNSISDQSEESSIADPGVSVRLIKTKKQLEEEAIGKSMNNISLMQAQISKKLQVFTQLMEENIAKINDQSDKFKNQVYSKMQQNDSAHFQTKFSGKIEEIKHQYQQQNQKLLKQIQIINQCHEEQLKNVELKLSQKIESSYFQQTMKNLNYAITNEFSQQEKFFSNKIQTQRAIRFLQNKINKLVEESPAPKIKKQLNLSNQPQLKIKNCESHKKLEYAYSSKSIKEMIAQDEAVSTPTYNFLKNKGIHHRSLDSSKVDIIDMSFKQPWKRQQRAILERAVSTSVNWKMNSENNQNKIQSRIRKTSVYKMKERESFVNTASQQQKLGAKQWKEKVVKILTKGDRKKRKVTFR